MVAKALELFKQLESLTGLEVRDDKCSVHCPPDQPDVCRRAKAAFQQVAPGLPVVENLNVKVLQQPVGSPEYTQRGLFEKLEQWQKALSTYAKMAQSHPHQATTLLQHCCGQSKAVHVART